MLNEQCSKLVLIKFLHRHATCPVCRQRLVVNEEEGYDGGNGEDLNGGDEAGGLEEID